MRFIYTQTAANYSKKMLLYIAFEFTFIANIVVIESILGNHYNVAVKYSTYMEYLMSR